MNSKAIRVLLDRYGRYNQEPDLFLQVVQALEEYLLHLEQHERDQTAAALPQPIFPAHPAYRVIQQAADIINRGLDELGIPRP